MGVLASGGHQLARRVHGQAGELGGCGGGEGLEVAVAGEIEGPHRAWGEKEKNRQIMTCIIYILHQYCIFIFINYLYR